MDIDKLSEAAALLRLLRDINLDADMIHLDAFGFHVLMDEIINRIQPTP